MARRKQVSPMQRIPSGEVMQSPFDSQDDLNSPLNGHVQRPGTRVERKAPKSSIAARSVPSEPGYVQLIVCVAGIYASFLSWALLQERITTTPYTPTPNSLNAAPGAEYFSYPVILNTIQSLFASLTGSVYLFSSSKQPFWQTSIFPSSAIIAPLLLVSLTSSLASPFGYASLAHVDYLTFVLAKSCKLLPVMFLHITLFQRRYPLSKYVIVLAVTAGVALFTIYHPPSGSKSKAKAKSQSSSIYGLTLLGINLLFDGLTNTVQDHIFTSPARYGKFSGPQMMVAQNIIATLLTSAYLLLTPMIPLSLLPTMAQSSGEELSAAIDFLQRHPSVLYDVLGFATCGAVGQLFIFATLERFSSLLLVTVTVTRKMLTMLLSVLWFGKRLTGGQWLGVGLVFSGIGAEGWIQQRGKKKKKLEQKPKSR